MNKILKTQVKIVTMILSLTILITSVPAYAAEKDSWTDKTATLKEIEDCAERQVDSIAEIAGNSNWKDCTFDKRIALFDSQNNINAYYIELTKNGKNCGYIIVGVDNKIIEYSYDKCSFIQVAKDEIEDEFNIANKKQKIYYLGGINYVIGGKDKKGQEKYIDISMADTEEIKEKELDDISISNENSEYSQSSPPDSKDEGYIVNPDLYEKGYDSSKTKNVKNWNLYYMPMDNFDTGKICAPVAATNFMRYWHNRGNKYKKLFDGWDKTYKQLFKYMNTSKSVGTDYSMIVTGYTKYLNSKKYNFSIKYHKGTNKGKDVMREINKDRPCHLLLKKHAKYGDHSVLAVGYQQFVYEHWYGDNCETYIRIADGWTCNASRFVWGGCKGTWDYVSIDIK